MKGDGLYWFLAHAFDVFIWGGELLGRENLPEAGPAVFVSNHALALGPIAAVASLPLRVYPWVISDMLDWDKAAAYLNQDFVEPQLHIPPSLSMPLARLISQFSVRLLRAVGSIPVWQGDALFDTYRQSVDLLAEGKNLLIFPEDPKAEMDEQYKMTPFKKGFGRLGEIFHKQTGKILRFYPLAVHAESRRIRSGIPILFNPNNNPMKERLRIKSVLEAMIREMVLDMSLESYVGIPLPH